MKCKICGIEKDTRRKMHGHLMHEHYDEYKAAGCCIERFCSDAPPAKRPIKCYPAKRPAGFRFLHTSNIDENFAIEQGYTFIDSEQNLYTEQEAKTEHWI